MDNTEDREAELKRKEEALIKGLDTLKASGKDTVFNRNRLRADIEIDDQLDRYKDKPPKWTPNQSMKMREWSPEKNKAFIIETRRDALHSLMNSESILNRLRRLEQIDRALVRLEIAVLITLSVLVILIIVQFVGWPELLALFKPT